MEMPAWVLSVKLGSGAVQQGVENAVFVSDADANIKRLPVLQTLDSDTCTIKYVASSTQQGSLHDKCYVHAAAQDLIFVP